ncbi:L,D-transpeptidase family protein [Methylocaldum sp. GT1TLB]|uniref:L,D-transpeptidase family protein n=1 Tax=Methylocaldum sp. GT1TLB TaxID=3438965 RepID=UPI003DA0E7FA
MSNHWHGEWGWLPPPIEEPVKEPVEESAPIASPPIASLEKHRFSVTKDEGVVGSFGVITLQQGDTLPDIARHFGLGYEEIVAANPELDPWVPSANSRTLIPVQFVLPRAPRRGVVINLAAMRMFHFPAKGNGAEVVTYPVGIGREGRATPTGAMRIARKIKNPTWYPTKNIRDDHLRRGDPLPAAVPPGPDNPLGKYALYLNRQMYLIHGTNKPYSVGLRASNGCIRLYPEDASKLYSRVPLNEPVYIVNQPYLVGWRDGVVYLQAYPSHEELNEKLLKKTLRANLKKWERDQNQPLDWGKIERIVQEGLGIPLPITAGTPPVDAVLAGAQPIVRPDKWFGQPEPAPEASNGWYVFAAETASEMTAQRLAAVLNHQGPPIPTRAVLNGERYQVIAGPFANAKAAKTAVKRLKVDLELEGHIIAPRSKQATKPSAEPAVRETVFPNTELDSPVW